MVMIKGPQLHPFIGPMGYLPINPEGTYLPASLLTHLPMKDMDDEKPKQKAT
jgi:hypothetical protein